MTRDEPSLLEIVVIGDTEVTRSLELAGAEAVVLGFSEDEGTNERWLAVQVGDMPAVMLPSSSVKRTGRAVSRESIYPGEQLRITQEGSAVRDGVEPVQGCDDATQDQRDP
ncbi:MAG: hypothetical protein KQH57_20620 [Actinomycetales bacterium]|nr:hypothetical protein [Actinomycetales bacterium]